MRPPSVSESLWNAVPPGLRAEFLARTAKELRRGVHPEESIVAQLESRGLNRPVKAAPGTKRPAARKPPNEPEAVQVAVRTRPIMAYGARPLPSGQEPLSEIGHAIHGEMRLPGKAGRAAAEAEASVLKAIAADPVMAYFEPERIRFQGACVSDAVAKGIMSLVRQEADLVIGDLRSRLGEGDARLGGWIDPDGWSFGLDDGGDGHSP